MYLKFQKNTKVEVVEIFITTILFDCYFMKIMQADKVIILVRYHFIYQTL